MFWSPHQILEWFLGSLVWTLLTGAVGLYLRHRTQKALPLFSTFGAITAGSLLLGAIVAMGPRLLDKDVRFGLNSQFILGAGLSSIGAYLLIGFWLPRAAAFLRDSENADLWSNPEFLPSWWRFFVLPLHIAAIAGIINLFRLLLFS